MAMSFVNYSMLTKKPLRHYQKTRFWERYQLIALFRILSMLRRDSNGFERRKNGGPTLGARHEGACASAGRTGGFQQRLVEASCHEQRQHTALAGSSPPTKKCCQPLSDSKASLCARLKKSSFLLPAMVLKHGNGKRKEGTLI